MDFNRAHLSETPVNVELNRLIEEAAALDLEPPRKYLGASAIGSPCPRKIQYNWRHREQHAARAKDIFARGHHSEERMREHLKACGFVFRPVESLGFKALEGRFAGHADGIIIGGPQLPGVSYPCLWENKCLGHKGWKDIERDGLAKHYPEYVAQVLLYQAYLKVTEHPAIFTVVNANSCEILCLLIEFDAELAQNWSDRALQIIEATDRNELLPRLTENPNDWRCKMCTHNKRCRPHRQ